MKRIKVLVSSLALPSEDIGSWVVRIQKFQKDLGYFDFILSPGRSADSAYIFCEKKPIQVGHRFLPRRMTSGNRVESYLSQLKKIASEGNSIQAVVMDDQFLLEQLAKLKREVLPSMELIFSYHGHALHLSPVVMDQVDKVLFLTLSGYQGSLKINTQFTPLVYIVGNGVIGDDFFPLSLAEKKQKRLKAGFNQDDLILIWMSNARRVKGLHLFKKLADRLSRVHPNLKIISIGHEKDETIHLSNWRQIGRIPNQEIAQFLQISDIYCFTSLWDEGFGLSLAEAIKCGNWALASALGGIPEVTQGYPNTVLVNNPNILENWLEGFRRLLDKRTLVSTDEEVDFSFFNDFQDYQSWQDRYLKALLD